MGNILRATFFAAVLSPFTAWVCLEATKHRNASGPYMSWPTRWYILLAIGTVILQISLIERLRYHLRARAKGCLSAPCYPHKDPFLGLDLLIPVIRAFKENTVIYNFQRRFEKYGHTHWSIAFTDWTINTEDPENIKAILTNIDDFPIAGPRLHTVLPLLGSESIFASNGQAWHNARSMLRPTFVRDQIADLECFDRHISNLLRAIPRDGSTFDMQKLLLDMTMDSSTDFMLGYSTNLLIKPLPEARKFIQAFEYVSATMGRRGSTGTAFLPSRELDDQIKIIQSFVESYMVKALADGRKHARERKYVFLDAMADSGASMEYIRDQVLSIIIAGRDTTAGAISSTIYFLARHPEVVAKVREEVLELNEKNPSWEQLKNMSYLSNTIKEALRLFPPIAVNSRTSSREVTLPRGGGPDGRSPILVPKGTPARWSAFCMQRRQDLYGPDAEEFRPERWEKLRPGWEYLPFSGGPRICVGQQFATTQVIFTIYRLLQNFKSIQARESGMMLVKTTTTSILANGCQISMEPA